MKLGCTWRFQNARLLYTVMLYHFVLKWQPLDSCHWEHWLDCAVRLRWLDELHFGVRDAGWVQLDLDCCRCFEVSSRWNWYTYHYYGCGNIVTICEEDEKNCTCGWWRCISRGSMYQVWTKLKWHANFISLVTLISMSIHAEPASSN